MIWKEFSGKKISANMLKSLLASGRTQLLSFSGTGGPYKARIVLQDRSSGKLNIERST